MSLRHSAQLISAAGSVFGASAVATITWRTGGHAPTAVALVLWAVFGAVAFASGAFALAVALRPRPVAIVAPRALTIVDRNQPADVADRSAGDRSQEPVAA